MSRCEGQIAATLDSLEADRAQRPSSWWFGESMGHADIAVACALTLAVEALGFVLEERRWPLVRAHRTRCEARPKFRAIHQPFFPPPATT